MRFHSAEYVSLFRPTELSGAVGDQTLVIRKDGESNQIIVQHWSASKNLNITLDDNVTSPPAQFNKFVQDRLMEIPHGI